MEQNAEKNMDDITKGFGGRWTYLKNDRGQLLKSLGVVGSVVEEDVLTSMAETDEHGQTPKKETTYTVLNASVFKKPTRSTMNRTVNSLLRVPFFGGGTTTNIQEDDNDDDVEMTDLEDDNEEMDEEAGMIPEVTVKKEKVNLKSERLANHRKASSSYMSNIRGKSRDDAFLTNMEYDPLRFDEWTGVREKKDSFSRNALHTGSLAGVVQNIRRVGKLGNMFVIDSLPKELMVTLLTGYAEDTFLLALHERKTRINLSYQDHVLRGWAATFNDSSVGYAAGVPVSQVDILNMTQRERSVVVEKSIEHDETILLQTAVGDLDIKDFCVGVAGHGRHLSLPLADLSGGTKRSREKWLWNEHLYYDPDEDEEDLPAGYYHMHYWDVVRREHYKEECVRLKNEAVASGDEEKGSKFEEYELQLSEGGLLDLPCCHELKIDPMDSSTMNNSIKLAHDVIKKICVAAIEIIHRKNHMWSTGLRMESTKSLM
jgi:hypothetical protein